MPAIRVRTVLEVHRPVRAGRRVQGRVLLDGEGFAALHENDGKLGLELNNGVVNGFGPELRGTTSEPGLTWFANTSQTEQSLVIRIESAFTCDKSSIVTPGSRRCPSRNCCRWDRRRCRRHR